MGFQIGILGADPVPDAINVRNRPIVANGTLLTDTGQIMRAGRVQQGVAAAKTSAFWTRARALGLNTIRFGARKLSMSLSAWLADIDAVVAAARNTRMYVMLGNPEQAAGSWGDAIAANRAISIDNWTALGPRYANETHVFYEMLNEPERWGSWTNYAVNSAAHGYPATPLTIALHDVFEVMRSAAPQTVILVPSCANMDADGGVAQFIRAPQAFENLGGVDWNRTVWAFHGYNQTGRMQVNSKYTSTGPDPRGANFNMAPDMGRAALAWLKDRIPICGTESNWWVDDGKRDVMLDFTDASEDAQVGWTIMSYPQQAWGIAYQDFALYPNFIDAKIDQLRARGFDIPVE